MLLLSALQNGLLEEVLVTGYLLTRLRKLGVNPGDAIAISATLRGSYHLYQGFGGFARQRGHGRDLRHAVPALAPGRRR